MKNICFYILILIIILLPGLSKAQEDTSAASKFQQYLDDIYKYPKEIENKNIFSLNTGVSFLSLAENFETDLSRSYIAGFRYGFIRFNDEIDAPGRVYAANEYVYLQSVSSHIKLKGWDLTGIPTDGWRFGFAFRNGYGYVLGKKQYLTLTHAGALNWSRIDVEWPSLIPADQAVLEKFDEEFRFGTEYEAGVNYGIADFLQAELAYNHTIVMPGVENFKFAVSALLELAVQRTIDYAAYEYIWRNPDEVPYANFLVKNIVSYLLYQLRRYDMHWPFQSKEPLNYDSIRLHFTFIF